jgi:hypothetical protein
MKKLLIFCVLIVGLFIITPIVSAQTWFPANQATVAWDAVAPLAADDVIKYQVYMRQDTTSEGIAVGAEITETSLVVSFQDEGRYFLGVETIRYPVGEVTGIKSERKAWSNIVADCSVDGPFGIVYYVRPSTPSGLRHAN